MESPGGYQLYGRTLPTWQTWGKGFNFSLNQPWLLEPFDQVCLYVVSLDIKITASLQISFILNQLARKSIFRYYVLCYPDLFRTNHRQPQIEKGFYNGSYEFKVLILFPVKWKCTDIHYSFK